MNAAEKQNILRKIEALLAKTTENGATEAEALLAAEKASQLMAQSKVRSRAGFYAGREAGSRVQIQTALSA